MRTITKIFFSLFLLYTLFGFFVLPFIVKSQLIKAVETTTYAKVHVEHIYVNPLIFRMEIDGFALEDSKKNPLLSFDSFCFNFEPHALFMKTLRLKKIELQNPVVSVVMDANKSLNLLSIVKPTQQEKSQNKESNTTDMDLPRIILDDVAIVNGVVEYKDFTHKSPFDFTVDRIGFHIEHFDTQNKNSYGNDGSVRFYATLGDGGFIDLKTQLDSFTPLALHGSLDFEASKLYTQWRYLQDMLNIEVADGKISLHTEYVTAFNELNTTQLLNTNLHLSGLRLKPKGKAKDILDLQNVVVQSSSLYPLTHKGTVEKILLDGLHVKVKKKQNGEIDWVYYTHINSEHKSQKSPVKKTKQEATLPWNIDIQDVAFRDMNLIFQDDAIIPHVRTKVEKFSLYAQHINTLGKKPFEYQMTTLVNDTTPCTVGGKLAFAKLDVWADTQCKNFNIVHYKPYIDKATKEQFSVFNLDLKSALTSLGVQTHIYDTNGAVIVMVEDANMSLDKLQVKKKTTQRTLLGMKTLQVHHAKVDTQKKDITVDDVTIRQLALYLRRYKNKKLNIDNLVIAKKSKKSKKENSSKHQKSTPYHLLVKQFSLHNAKVQLRDYALQKPQKHIVDHIEVALNNIDSTKRSWMRYKTTLRINRVGKLYAKGKLRASPLKEQGYFSLRNVALSALTPYLQESTYIDIYDGRLSMKGYTTYAPSKQHPDLSVKGDFTIDSLFINNTQDDSFLFSMNKFFIKSYTLELFKNRLFIDEMDVDSFYVNAKIDEHKVMNLATLVKKSPQQEKKTVVGEKKQHSKKDSFPISIVKVNVTNGSAKFSDFSIPIKFQTDIHDLNGVIYAISNIPNETTYLKVRGEVDKYGSTLLKGSLDGSDPKKYTDIDFNFQNLDLSSLSGYSAEFAGYKIDSGKLFLDLGYKINDGKLLGSNSVIIKKIKLGDEIKDENVTHLPLGFVIGLLEDSDGIIDIDMPVEGDINKPDFKYGALVWKTFTNLIAKAVTSPFKFLGSMLGMNSDDLEYVVFESGSATITPPEREKLDTLAKMMLKRPKLLLDIQGGYDKEKDTLALQKEKLIALVIQKSGDKNIKDKENAITVDMLETIYEDHYGSEKLDTLKEKLLKKYEHKKQDFKRAYQEVLVDESIAMQKVTQEELLALAHKRADAIFRYLQEEKQISMNRLKLLKQSYISDEKEGVMVKLEISVSKVK